MFRRLAVFSVLALFLVSSTHAGLPSADKIQNLKRKIDKELSKYFRIQNQGGKCLIAPAAPNQPIVSGDCAYAPPKVWWLDGAQLKSMVGDTCLQPQANPNTMGGALTVAACNGQPIQTWRYEQGQVKTIANTCVEILPAEIAKEGGRVQIAVCAPGAHQQWKPIPVK